MSHKLTLLFLQYGGWLTRTSCSTPLRIMEKNFENRDLKRPLKVSVIRTMCVWSMALSMSVSAPFAARSADTPTDGAGLPGATQHRHPDRVRTSAEPDCSQRGRAFGDPWHGAGSGPFDRD